MGIFKEMLHSKKFWYAIVSLVVAIVGFIKPEWAQMTQDMLYGLIALILGQGFADMGKEAKKIAG